MNEVIEEIKVILDKMQNDSQSQNISSDSRVFIYLFILSLFNTFLIFFSTA